MAEPVGNEELRERVQDICDNIKVTVTHQAEKPTHTTIGTKTATNEVMQLITTQNKATYEAVMEAIDDGPTAMKQDGVVWVNYTELRQKVADIYGVIEGKEE